MGMLMLLTSTCLVPMCVFSIFNQFSCLDFFYLLFSLIIIFSSFIQNNQNQQPQPVSQQTNNYQGNSISSEYMPYYTHGCDDLQNQMPGAPCSLGSSGHFTSNTAGHPRNNFQPTMSTPVPNKGYPLQPPPPTVSNQFSYIQAEAQQRAPSWGSGSSFGDRLQHVHGPRGGNFYCDRNMRGPIQYENAERGRFSPPMNEGMGWEVSWTP